MATKTHDLIFSRGSAFDLGSAFARLGTVSFKTEGGGPRPPDRVDVSGEEARVHIGPKHLRVGVTPLAEAVALLHRTIELDRYTEADQFVYKPGQALRVSAELDHDRDPTLFWCFNPETLDLDYDGEDEPVYVRDPDDAVCFDLVNHFPPAVFLMGSEDPDGIRLCFASDSGVGDSD